MSGLIGYIATLAVFFSAFATIFSALPLVFILFLALALLKISPLS